MRNSKREYELGLVANEIAKRAAAVPNITNAGALMILDRAKGIIEKSMKEQPPIVPDAITDEWGQEIKTPQDKA